MLRLRSDLLYDLKKNLNILAKSYYRPYFSISFLSATVGGQIWLNLSSAQSCRIEQR